MHTGAAGRLLLLLTSTFLSVANPQQQTQDPPKPSKLSGQSITKTPATRALCLPVSGDSQSYADSMTTLVTYTNAHSIRTEGFVFSTNWKQGPDPSDPGKGASWEVCIESSDPASNAVAPFAIRDLKPEEAGYGVCVGTADDLPECFAALDAFVQTKQYHPVAPPRYKLKGVNNSSKKNVYEIWLPVVIVPPEPPKAGTEQPK